MNYLVLIPIFDGKINLPPGEIIERDPTDPDTLLFLAHRVISPVPESPIRDASLPDLPPIKDPFPADPAPPPDPVPVGTQPAVSADPPADAPLETIVLTDETNPVGESATKRKGGFLHRTTGR